MLLLPYENPVVRATFLRRYKRFFVDCRLGGKTITAHTNNTGAMTGMLHQGADVLLTYDKSPKRKLDYTLQAIDIDGAWAGCNTILPNRFVAAAIERKLLRGFHAPVTREIDVTAGGHKGRIDLKAGDALVEVKTVTLRDGRMGRFPDAKSERARRHLQLLGAAKGRRHVAFLCQRNGIDSIGPAYEIDPAYARAMHNARDAGVGFLGIRATVDERGLSYAGRIPVRFRTSFC